MAKHGRPRKGEARPKQIRRCRHGLEMWRWGMEDLDVLRDLRNSFAYLSEGWSRQGDKRSGDWARSRLAWCNAEIARRIEQQSSD